MTAGTRRAVRSGSREDSTRADSVVFSRLSVPAVGRSPHAPPRRPDAPSCYGGMTIPFIAGGLMIESALRHRQGKVALLVAVLLSCGPAGAATGPGAIDRIRALM